MRRRTGKAVRCSNVSTEDVISVSCANNKYYRYKAQGAMKNEKGNPDRCQFFNVAQDDILGNEAPHANPKPVQDNRETFLSFLCNARCIIELILEIIDAKLGLIKGTLASLQRQDRPSGSVIRMTRYSPWSPTEQNSGSALVNHTDYGTITMLCNILGGLQILPPGKSS